MVGSVKGGKKAAIKNLENDPNFYSKIGKIGGSRCGIKKGFAAMSPERRAECGRKGGSISRRGPSMVDQSKIGK